MAVLPAPPRQTHLEPTGAQCYPGPHLACRKVNSRAFPSSRLGILYTSSRSQPVSGGLAGLLSLPSSGVNVHPHGLSGGRVRREMTQRGLSGRGGQVRPSCGGWSAFSEEPPSHCRATTLPCLLSPLLPGPSDGPLVSYTLVGLCLWNFRTVPTNHGPLTEQHSRNPYGPSQHLAPLLPFVTLP